LGHGTDESELGESRKHAGGRDGGATGADKPAAGEFLGGGGVHGRVRVKVKGKGKVKVKVKGKGKVEAEDDRIGNFEKLKF
jgi:hypothetical protein